MAGHLSTTQEPECTFKFRLPQHFHILVERLHYVHTLLNLKLW